MTDLGLQSVQLWGLHRFQQAWHLHFITFSCHHRDALLSDPQFHTAFEQTLERVRRWYGFFVTGYVVMPEHVHLLISEPERGTLSIALQMLKQITEKSGDRRDVPIFSGCRARDRLGRSAKR